jgi:hypothetical protein
MVLVYISRALVRIALCTSVASSTYASPRLSTRIDPIIALVLASCLMMSVRTQAFIMRVRASITWLSMIPIPFPSITTRSRWSFDRDLWTWRFSSTWRIVPLLARMIFFSGIKSCMAVSRTLKELTMHWHKVIWPHDIEHNLLLFFGAVAAGVHV